MRRAGRTFISGSGTDGVRVDMTMRMRPTEYPHILWNEDKGVACVAGTRLKVSDVVAHYLAGEPVESIVENFPPHTPAEIFSALAYYHDHIDDVDREMADRRHRAEAVV